MTIPLPRLIRRAAEQYSDRIAIVHGEQRLTFRQVNERACRLANALAALGITTADRVGTIRKNAPEHVEMALAFIKGGSVPVTLNPRLTADELVWQLNDSGSTAVIMGPEFTELILSIRERIPAVKHLIAFGPRVDGTIAYEDLIASGEPAEPEFPWLPDDIGNIGYSSGTTGRPKGIVRSRRSEHAVVINILLDVLPHMTENDVFLALQPLYHGAGSFVLPCWLRGVRHVIVPSFEPDVAFRAIREEGVSIIKTVPTVYVRLLADPALREQDFSRLHTLIYGGSPMPVDKLKEGMDVFGPVFVQIYGQGEAPMTITVMRREDHIVDGTPEQTARLRSAGRPFTLVDVRVVHDDGRDVVPGEIGEIIVRGDHVMKGYWQLPPERTAETLRDGWVYTRDVGTVDAGGFIYLLDRKSEMIITGGLNVYPNEVEQVLYQHPAVLEAAVIGVPDPLWVEAIKACVVLRPGAVATDQEILDFCRTRLADYKRPRSVDFHGELPKNAAAKILRRKLREPYWQKTGQGVGS